MDHGADREYVGSPVELIDEPHRLLGRHVRGGAERRAGGRALAGGAPHLRDAEVEHLHLAGAREEDVRGLQVAVDDADGVARREAIEHGVGDPEHLRDRHHAPGALPRLADGLPLEELHHEERLPLLGDVVVQHAHAGRVADLVRDVRFAEEAVAHDAVARELRVEDLERRPLPVPVRRRVHRGHPADAEKRVQVPLAPDGRPDARLGAVVGLRRARFRLRRVERFGHALCFPSS